MKIFENKGPADVLPYPNVAKMIYNACSNASSICDYGCGYGNWIKYIMSISDAHISAFDIDQGALEYTKRMIGNKWVDPEGSFDVILLFAILEILEPEEQRLLLLKLRSKLSRELLIQYNVYNPLSLRWLIIRCISKSPKEWHEKERFHRSYLSHEEVEEMFSLCGYKIIQRVAPTVDNHLPRFVNNIASWFTPLIMKSTFFYRLAIVV
jgi:hypothetical protein